MATQKKLESMGSRNEIANNVKRKRSSVKTANATSGQPRALSPSSAPFQAARPPENKTDPWATENKTDPRPA